MEKNSQLFVYLLEPSSNSKDDSLVSLDVLQSGNDVDCEDLILI